MPSHPVILSAVRTLIGSFQGCLRDMPATQLGSLAISEAVILMPWTKCSWAACSRLGWDKRRLAKPRSGAGLSPSCGASTVNKVCGLSLKAVIMAAQAIGCEQVNVAVAGGMESMSRVPYLVESARAGYRLGHA
jgi:acetyl-CoA C-acetyltransferase